jgi:lantibiotic modifying enzyme
MKKTIFTQKELIEIVGQASSITERLSSEYILEERGNDHIVNSRLEDWCQIVAEGNWGKFEKRLAWDSIDLTRLRRALGIVYVKNEHQLPAWAKMLNECMKATSPVTLETLEKETLERNHIPDRYGLLPFEEILLSFIYVAKEKLIAQAGSHYHLLSKEAHNSLQSGLMAWLSHLFSLSMELEFSIFRASRKSTVARFMENTTDSNSRKQYRDFIQGLLAGGLLTFFKEYPVLARLAATAIDSWVEVNGEFLSRLASDRCEIQKTFHDEIELGKVVTVQSNLSDRHHNGRSVII